MYKSSILFVFLIALSICSSLRIDDEGVENVQYYYSSANGFWPMPGGNIANNGYTDMGAIEFTGDTTTTLRNDEGDTRSAPILDRNGFVYTIQKTNFTTGYPMCSIECYDPAGNDKHLWSRQLDGYPLDGDCFNALLVLNSNDTITALVDGYLFQYQLTFNHTSPLPTPPFRLSYNSSLLIPVTTNYFIIDNLSTNQLHLIYYQTVSNCTGNCTVNSTIEDTVDFSDFNTGLIATAASSPAIHSIESTDYFGLVDQTPTYLITANDNTIVSFNLLTRTQAWSYTLDDPQTFMSNAAIATDINVVFVLVVTNIKDNSEIILQGYNTTNGEKLYSPTLFGPLAGAEMNIGRLSVDVHNHQVLAMVEESPSNNTIVYAYNYVNYTLFNRSLNEANFQGPMSIDLDGRYYVITSQFSGYLALNSSDLSQVQRMLDTSNGETNVQRNYAALGNNTLVVTGSKGTVGLGPNTGGGSDGGSSKTWIILLSVLGGLILIIFLIALACLIYHYYTRHRRAGYEVV